MAAYNRNLWDTVKELVLEQYKGSPKFLAMLQAVIEESVQPLDSCALELADALDVYKAEGALLDVIGKLVCTEREYGETDEYFRARIIGLANENRAGTPDFVIKSSIVLSGDPRPHYMDEAPATFFVYTPNGRQLKRATVKKMAPAGVLGLPGAAILFADGSLMGDAQGKKILMVADDSRIESDTILIDESNRPIVNNRGTLIRAIVKGSNTQVVNVYHGGVSYNAIRIKDLPDDDGTGGYMVRDSSTRGTVKTDSMSEEELETLWNNTEPEGA